MLLLGLIVAVSVHIIGALLVMALLVTPAAAAMRIASGPARRCPCSRRLFGFVSAVGGILLAIAGTLPVSPYITTISFVIYVVCRGIVGARPRVGSSNGADVGGDAAPRARRARPPRVASQGRVGRIAAYGSSATRGSAIGCAKRSADARGFVSAQSLHATLREENTGIGLATVYRALAGLAAQGDADSLQSPDGESLYRACKTPGHHHHLICRSCGLDRRDRGDRRRAVGAPDGRRARLQRGRARRRHLRAVRGLRAGPGERA